ncbi:protein spaetzle 5 [Neocloeon triangulifer]|uniref:protein spaetzle 5 n=1 Tax=Neocloeon triangulifer TaxID=2078957 RepID=UPI00286ECC47|nr:protein spaetzle 5 [Neocloeon triangulifer]
MCSSMTPARGGSFALLSLVVISYFQPLLSSPQCQHYGGCRDEYRFLPVPPGKTPYCAKPGETFCEKIENYPVQLIRYLAEKWKFDHKTLLLDESREGFAARWTPKPYGPSAPSYSYSPPPSPSYNKVIPTYYPQNRNTFNSTYGRGFPSSSLRPPQPSTPYYPASYFSSLLPNQYTPTDNWWNRYSRSVAGKQQKRRKRQAGPTALCATTSRFVGPQAGMSNTGIWKYLVNVDGLSQEIETVQCRSEGSSCNGLCSLPNGYTSRCQQQYVQKRLLSLDGSGNQLATDVFWFPHCCTCNIIPN